MTAHVFPGPYMVGEIVRLFTRFVLIAMLAPASNGQHAAPLSVEPEKTQPYKQLRHDEDWADLKDTNRRTDYLDSIKYLPLRNEERWYLSVGGEIRQRYERFANPSWGKDPPDNNGFFLQRYMLHVDVHLGSRIRFFGQIKSGLENGKEGGPRLPDEDKLDLHQAFLDLHFHIGAPRSLAVRAGRQELAFGSSRLVSIRDLNVRQSFDGLRATLSAAKWRIDGFVSKPVETSRGIWDDATDHARTFWGAYAVRPWGLLPNGNFDVYYLGIDRKAARFDQGTGREIRHSAGTRLWGTTRSWDYNYELVYQWGSFGSGKIRAWTVASDNGYTLSNLNFHPRIGVKVDLTSGDPDPAHPSLQTFNPLFPRGAYFGEIALIGPSNHIDIHPSVDLRLRKDIKLTADTVLFWRQTLNDGIYGNATNLLRSGSMSQARFVGSQPSIQMEWQISRHLSWSAVVSHFVSGTFLRESGSGRDVKYVASWLTYRF